MTTLAEQVRTALNTAIDEYAAEMAKRPQDEPLRSDAELVNMIAATHRGIAEALVLIAEAIDNRLPAV